MKITAVRLKKVTDNSYPILVKRGLLLTVSTLLKRDYKASRYVIITDETAKTLFGAALKVRLQKAGLDAMLISIPDGERSKNRKTKEMIETKMLKATCDRKTVILALGGGVVGDMAGFVASTYMRGIRYIQVPTTMLAMVDSAIGGKVGIDTPEGKNTVGAFHQPEAVLCDPECLKSIPPRLLSIGLVEAAKVFMTSDKKSFEYLEKNLGKVFKRDARALEEVIARAARIKAGVVSIDETEVGPRMVLNFGHTIGHALEKLSNYTIPHGHAVALGILCGTRASHMLGLLRGADAVRVTAMIDALGIDRTPLKKFSPEAIMKAAKTDKKSLKGRPRYILLSGIGKAYIKGGYAHEVSESLITEALLASRN